MAQTFGIKGGLNLSKMVTAYDGETPDGLKFKPGFQVGLTLESPINDNLGFETGIMLASKGSKLEYSEDSFGGLYEIDQTVNTLYIDIPLNLKAYFGEGETKFFGTFGPYLAYALSGQTEVITTIAGVSETENYDIEIGSDDPDSLKALDFGVGLGVGVVLSGIELSVNYNLGLANLSNDDDDDFTIKNNVIALSAGYKFGN